MRKVTKAGWYKVQIWIEHYKIWRCLYWNGQWSYGNKVVPPGVILDVGNRIIMPDHNWLEEKL